MTENKQELNTRTESTELDKIKSALPEHARIFYSQRIQDIYIVLYGIPQKKDTGN